MKEMNLLFSLSKGYVPYLTVVLQSIKQNNPNTYFHCYIVNKEFGEQELLYFREIIGEEIGEIHFIKITDEMRKIIQEVYGETYTSYPEEAKVKVLYPWIIPEDIDRVLVLGVDVILNGNLAELYDMDFEDKLIIGCADINMREKKMYVPQWENAIIESLKRFTKGYINTDVMLLDVKKIRREITIDDLKKAGEDLSHNIPLIDQDITSWVFASKIKLVEHERYNCMILEDKRDLEGYGEGNKRLEYDYVKKNSLLIQFNSKPWNFSAPHYSGVHKIWWEYAIQTRFGQQWFFELIHSVQSWKDKARFLERRSIISIRESIEKIIREYFEKNNYHKIGVYGAGEYGKIFLHDAPKEYVYKFYDKKVRKLGDYQVESLEALIGCNDLDVVVITNFYLENVMCELAQILSIPLKSYYTIINEAYYYRYDKPLSYLEDGKCIEEE